MKRILLLLTVFGIAACDTEGEIIQGRTLSSVAPHSGAAGGHSPVIGGVYYDSPAGLTISHPGNEGDVLMLNADMEPVWTNATTGAGILSSGQGQQQSIQVLMNQNQALEAKVNRLEKQLEKLLEKQELKP